MVVVITPVEKEPDQYVQRFMQVEGEQSGKFAPSPMHITPFWFDRKTTLQIEGSLASLALFSEFYTSPIKSTHQVNVVNIVDTSYRGHGCGRNMFPTSPNLRHLKKMDVLAIDLEDEPESCRFGGNCCN